MARMDEAELRLAVLAAVHNGQAGRAWQAVIDWTGDKHMDYLTFLKNWVW